MLRFQEQRQSQNNMKFQKPLNKNKEMLGFHGSMKNNRMHGLNKTMKNQNEIKFQVQMYKEKAFRYKGSMQNIFQRRIQKQNMMGFQGKKQMQNQNQNQNNLEYQEQMENRGIFGPNQGMMNSNLKKNVDEEEITDFQEDDMEMDNENFAQRMQRNRQTKENKSGYCPFTEEPKKI